MKSIYVSKLVCQEIWPDFISHFKSDTTKASYAADIQEIMNYYKKDFLLLTKEDIGDYYEVMSQKIKEGVLKPATMAKKFRELHSFAEYICENREQYNISENYEDFYHPYIKLLAKQEKFVKSVPIEHIDKLLVALEQDPMVYCIVVLLYRMGLTSTQVTELRLEDLGVYDNGVFVHVKGRLEASYVPEDVADVLNTYISMRQDNPYLFYNKRGNQLNTMYISRMMKKYTAKAGIPAYSAESIRNSCGVTMYAYGAKDKQVARKYGTTQMQIRRYKNLSYRDNLMKEADCLVKLKVMPPRL